MLKKSCKRPFCVKTEEEEQKIDDSLQVFLYIGTTFKCLNISIITNLTIIFELFGVNHLTGTGAAEQLVKIMKIKISAFT